MFKILIVNNTHRLPDSSKYLKKKFNKTFDKMINDANTLCDEIISIGNMSANYLNRNNFKKLKSIIEKSGFKQLITTLTLRE